jgi:hypothetical protein
LRRFLNFLLCVGIVGAAGCHDPSSAAAPSDGWVRECPRNAFCFSHPATLIAQPVQAIDSLVGIYRSDALTLSFDMGQYPTSVDHLVKPVEEPATIDGKSARLLYTESEIVMIIPKVRESATFKVQMTMTLKFKGDASRALAQRIFQSIEFK